MSSRGAAAAAPSRAYARYVLGVLFLVYVFNFVDRQILGILIGPIKADIGISDTWIGVLSGLTFVLFYSAAGISIARLADRRSRRDVIAVSLALWSGMTALTGAAQNLLHLVLTRIGVGVGEAGGSPPSHSLLSDYFPPERRATALALYANGIYVGSGLAFLFGGWIVTHFDWRIAYLAVGLAGLPLAVLVRLTVREVPRGLWEPAPREPVAQVGFFEAMRFLFSKPTFAWLVGAACFQALAGYGVLIWAAEFLSRVHQMERDAIGLGLGLCIAVGGCAGVSAGGWLSDRLSARDRRAYLRLPAVVSVLCLPFGLAFLLLDDVGPALASFLVYYTISNMYVGPLWAVPQNLARPEMRATVSAVLLFLLNLVGLGLGPFAIGLANELLAETHGAGAIRFSLVGVVAVGSLAAVPYWMGSRHLEDDLG